MNKNDLRVKMQSGFLEAAPDVYEAVLKAAEKNKLMPEDTILCEEGKAAEGGVEGEPDVCQTRYEERQAASHKGNILWGNFSKYALSFCAGFALVFMCLFGLLGRGQDDIYVMLDINPSIRMVMNKSYQVKKLEGLNQDGKDVIGTLEWKKKTPLLETLDILVEGAVKGSYLQEGGGILVTICASDQDLYEELESTMGTGIDESLGKMGISGVTTAFQNAESGSSEEGRKQLEAELAEKYGVDAAELSQMSVMELIEYCQEHGAAELELSPVSEKQWQSPSDKKGAQDEKNAQDEKDAQVGKPKKAKGKNEKKPKPDSESEPGKGKDKQPKDKKPGNKKDPEEGTPSQGSGQSSGNAQNVQPTQAPAAPAQPQPQPEIPQQPQPEDPPQDGNNPGQEDSGNGGDEDNNGNNGNNGNGNNGNNGNGNNGNNGNGNNGNGNNGNNGNGNNGNNGNGNNGNKDDKDNAGNKGNKDDKDNAGNKGDKDDNKDNAGNKGGKDDNKDDAGNKGGKDDKGKADVASEDAGKNEVGGRDSDIEE